jgi:hypothetical protein
MASLPLYCFFAAMLEYNFHRLITLLVRKETLVNDKHAWLRNNLTIFYILMAFSVAGFFICKKTSYNNPITYRINNCFLFITGI